MPLFEVTLAGTYKNQQTINRWNYVGSGTPAAVIMSFALASAFGAVYDEVAVPPGYPSDTVLYKISGFTSNEWTWQSLTVVNLYSDSDFYQTPFVNPYGGGNSGEAMSPVMAYGFRTNQVLRSVRRATKRFPGVMEDRVDDGGVINNTQLATLNDAAAKMSEVLSYDDEGNTLSFTPAVCGKQRYNPTTHLPDPAGTAYRYYPTEAEQLTHTAQGVLWQAYDTVRSQVSRQYGRGR